VPPLPALASVLRQDFAPAFGTGLENVSDRSQEHGFLVPPQTVEDVFPNPAALRQFRGGGAMVSQLAEDLADDGQQAFALFVNLARARHRRPF
jgi:hypothetical protein